MHRPLPPLNSLRAFEAAARHRSIRKAALELHVTPAAISQQVKGLEDYLGVPLFRRTGGGLILTREAEASVAKLREGFSALAGAVDLMHLPRRMERIRIGAAPSFAGKWLSPRIQGFVAAFADADVRIAADAKYIDPRQPDAGASFHRSLAAAGDFDVAIRFGTGNYPGRRVDKLFDVVATPLCSPRLLEGTHPLRTPADLHHHNLLHDDTISAEQGGIGWNDWLNAAGLHDIDTNRGAHFNHAVLGLEAAIDGAGVVLGYPVLASLDIARGRLVAPFALSVPVDFAYYAVSAESHPGEPLIEAFRQWLLDEADAAGIAPRALSEGSARVSPRQSLADASRETF